MAPTGPDPLAAGFFDACADADARDDAFIDEHQYGPLTDHVRRERREPMADAFAYALLWDGPVEPDPVPGGFVDRVVTAMGSARPPGDFERERCSDWEPEPAIEHYDDGDHLRSRADIDAVRGRFPALDAYWHPRARCYYPYPPVEPRPFRLPL